MEFSYGNIEIGHLIGFKTVAFICDGDKKDFKVKSDNVPNEKLDFVKDSKFSDKLKALFKKGW